MGLFDQFAKDIITLGSQPTRKPETIRQIGAGFTGGLAAGLAPKIKQETQDIITGEYALDPTRRELAKIAKTEWGSLANKFTQKQQDVLKLQEQLKEEYVLNTAGEKVSIKGLPLDKASFRQKMKERIKEQQEELKNISSEFNRVVPGKSELQKFAQAVGTDEKKPRNPGFPKVVWNKYTLERNTAERNLSEGASALDAAIEAKQIPKTSGAWLKRWMRNVYSGMDVPSIAAGKHKALEDSIFLELADIEKGKKYTALMNAYNTNLTSKMNSILKSKDSETIKTMKMYPLLIAAAKVGMEDEFGDVSTNVLSQAVLFNALEKSGLSYQNNFNLGNATGLLHERMMNQVIQGMFKENNDSREKALKVGKVAFNSLVKRMEESNIPLIVGITDFGSMEIDKVKDGLKRALFSDKLGGFAAHAPRNIDDFEKPKTSEQRAWLGLYQLAYGSDATYRNMTKLFSPARSAPKQTGAVPAFTPTPGLGGL